MQVACFALPMTAANHIYAKKTMRSISRELLIDLEVILALPSASATIILGNNSTGLAAAESKTITNW